MDVLADINEYLNPTTARWYANRGIPYRRGYLFYGPPGTGKTSLTFALAGVFGLDIHVVSLLEPTLTEEELGMLFTNLPARCIVLLEDIDTAGLIRVEAPEETTESDDKRDFNVGDLTKAFKKAKKLDEALIRPGRVDHQVPFSHASQTQIKELFERMYTDDLPTTKIVIAPDSQSDVLTPPMTPISVEFEKNGHGGEESELEDIARRFSKKVPENMFSPAEIQGFLLKRKTEPRKALEEVGEWVRGMEQVFKTA
ncbi:putative mitochondrial chaperone BCS1-A [Glarea lozoyensis 74030]|uniref:Putative mitochondrial chaperone BCS1-A n=1 Tax=Glarea lozoyensis (strain ATCC 74030 / MF5533) TaxID=1104152 RepID=H0EJ04_GLAL7|nr:putative mitochondrial chaperone BCS1-A [Glarea lozoyensis 74030]